MTLSLTQKESSLLEDMKSQESLCIAKYEKYSSLAKDGALKNIFTDLATAERSHLTTLTNILAGEEVRMSSASPSATDSVASPSECSSACSPEDKQNDAFLVKDALSMEKHVSSVYNTAIFEFRSPTLRDTLAHIQKEEQNHGEKLYSYLACNNMYGG